MQGSNLIKIFKSFSKEEIKTFGKFIRSPYFNTSDATAGLFKVMRDDNFNYKNDEPDKQVLFKKLYGNKYYSDLIMRKLFSNLNKLSGEYLVYTELKNDDKTFNMLMLKQMRKLRLDENILKLHKVLDTLYDKKNFLNPESHLRALEYYNEKFEFCLHSSKPSETVSIINNQVDFLLSYFIHKTGNIQHNLRYFKYYQNENTNSDTTEMIASCFDLIKLMGLLIHKKDVFSRKLLFTLLRTIITTDYRNEKAVNLLLEMLNDRGLGLSENEIISTFFRLQSVYELKIRDGVSTAMGELHAMFKSLIDGNYGFEKYDNGFFYHDFYVLIAESCIENDDIDWCGKYIEKYKKNLRPVYINDCYHLAKSIWLYGKRDFNRSLNELSLANSNEKMMFYKKYNWKLKLFYELGYYEELLHAIDSYNHYIKNNKSVQKGGQNEKILFTKFLKLITEAEIRNKPIDEYVYIKNSIIKIDYFNQKKWLINKCEEKEL